MWTFLHVKSKAKMKLLLLIGLVETCLGATSSSLQIVCQDTLVDAATKSRYAEFLRRFGRDSELEQIDCAKVKHFMENERLAEELNRDPQDSAEYSASHSPFGDMGTEEFQRKILMRSKDPNVYLLDRGSYEGYENAGTTVDAFDWAEKGVVSPVRQQGSLGTCYAFAAAGVVEGQLAIHYGQKNVSVSVEQSVECDRKSDKKTGNAVCGEFGGWPYLVFEFWSKGFVREKDFPYCAGMLDKSEMPLCFPCMVKGYDESSCGDHDDFYCNASSTLGQGRHHLCSDESWLDSHRIGTVKTWDLMSQNETTLALQLVSAGPLAAVLDARLLQLYRKGIYKPKLCSKTALNHAVLITGFDAQSWTVKNSWGTDWGEKGYFRIARGKSQCGINQFVTGATIQL